MFQGKRVLLGVSGGISAYKAAEVARLLVKNDCDVSVVMTENAQQFVTPLTFRSLTRKPVATKLFADPDSSVPHISLAQWAELVVIVPATADLIARAATGRADDLLSAILLDTDAPVLWAPAMNTRMWQHPLTQQNLKKLLELGHKMIAPEAGELACGETGEGRLAGVETIVEAVKNQLVAQNTLVNKTVLLTAGPTREPWDAIRYLSNRSTGKMGYALAQEAAARGARVILVSGPVALPAPPSVEVVAVQTAVEMHTAVMQYFGDADIFIATAAVADFRPAVSSSEKIKKHGGLPRLELVPNPDILDECGAKKTKQFVVGFAAETNDPIGSAKEKMKRKNCDLMIANNASGPDDAFAANETTITILDHQDSTILERQSKQQLAGHIMNKIEERCDSV